MMDRKRTGLLLCAGTVVVLFLMAGCSEESNHSKVKDKNFEQTEVKKYEIASIEDMINEVKNNALRANKIYKGKYVKIVNGQIGNIESDGDYFSLDAPNADFTLLHIKVRPQNSEQKEQLANLEINQFITVYGKITDVGEIMGYTVALDKLESADVAMKQMDSTIQREPSMNAPISRNMQSNTANLYDIGTPDGLFRYYHLAITKHQLSVAYDCFSDDFKSQIEYGGWAAGYDTTLQSTPEKVEVMFNDGYHATLSYRLKAVDRVGDSTKMQYFIGECNLIKINGVWKIDSISARYA